MSNVHVPVPSARVCVHVRACVHARMCWCACCVHVRHGATSHMHAFVRSWCMKCVAFVHVYTFVACMCTCTYASVCVCMCSVCERESVSLCACVCAPLCERRAFMHACMCMRPHVSACMRAWHGMARYGTHACLRMCAVCACTGERACVPQHAYVRAYAHARMHVCCACVRACLSACTSVCVHACVRACVCVRAWVHVRACANMLHVRCCRRAPAGHHPGLQAQVRCIARQQGQLAANASAQRHQGQ
jgi:hypothetical protein